MYIYVNDLLLRIQCHLSCENFQNIIPLQGNLRRTSCFRDWGKIEEDWRTFVPKSLLYTHRWFLWCWRFVADMNTDLLVFLYCNFFIKIFSHIFTNLNANIIIYREIKEFIYETLFVNLFDCVCVCLCASVTFIIIIWRLAQLKSWFKRFSCSWIKQLWQTQTSTPNPKL